MDTKSKLKTLHGIDPVEAWAELERVRETGGGLLRPADVVNAARPESAPLHRAFEWDDSKAAEKYRLQQARQLVRNFELVFEDRRAPALLSVQVERDGIRQRGYMPTMDVLQDGSLRMQVLREALAQYVALEKRFQVLGELAGVHESVHSVIESHGLRDLVT